MKIQQLQKFWDCQAIGIVNTLCAINLHFILAVLQAASCIRALYQAARTNLNISCYCYKCNLNDLNGINTKNSFTIWRRTDVLCFGLIKCCIYFNLSLLFIHRVMYYYNCKSVYISFEGKINS